MIRMILVLLAVLWAVPAFAAPGAGDVRAGNKYFKKGMFKEALEAYEKAAQKNPSEPKIEYDLGAASYKAGEHDRAVEYFQKSLLTDDEEFRKDVYYNLGNAFYYSGIGREETDTDEAVKRLESSIGSFEKAKAMDPQDKEASENYDFVKKELERLKKKQQEQKQCPRPNKDQQKNKDQQQQDQKQQQDQQQQPSQDEQQKQDEKQQQEGQQKQEEQQKNEQQQPDESKKAEQDNEAASGQTEDRQISSQKDANDMIDDFERNELPKGLLNFIRQPWEERPVEKDW